jgi:hypothetical protein
VRSLLDILLALEQRDPPGATGATLEEGAPSG